MLSLHLSIPLRSATPREGTVGSDTKAERNGDGKVLGKQCDGDSAPGSLLSPFTSYSFRSPPAHLYLRFGSPSVPVTMMR